MSPSLPRWICLAAALALAAPPQALGLGLPGGGFSVSGKKGPFLKQVAGRKFDAARGAGALGLASDAMNQGQFQAARLRMPQTEARVAELLASVEGHWPYAKGEPVKVHILGVDHYSAYSLPDGSIVVGFGLLDRAQSDDEVAFVLGHELGHLRLGHFAKGVALNRQRQAASKLGQAYVVGSALQGGLTSVAGGGGIGAMSAALDADGQAAARRAGAAGDLIHFITEVMIEPAWSRSQEDEADALGFDLAQAQAYSAESASARVFDTVQADETSREAEVEALQEQVNQELGRAVGEGAVQSMLTGGASTGGLLKGAGRIALSAAGSMDGGPKHRPPEERKKGIADYSVAAYPEGAPLRDEQTAWLTAVRASPEYAQAKVAVAAVKAAMVARAAGDYPEATTEIGKALKTSFKDAPVVLNEAARLRDDMGDAGGADRLFTQAHLSQDQTVDGYLDHVRMLYRIRDGARAGQVIDAGTERFNNDDKPFLSMKIALAVQEGQLPAAAALLQRCLGYNDPGLKKDCQLAGGDAVEGQQPARPELPRGLPFGLPGLP